MVLTRTSHLPILSTCSSLTAAIIRLGTQGFCILRTFSPENCHIFSGGWSCPGSPFPPLGNGVMGEIFSAAGQPISECEPSMEPGKSISDLFCVDWDVKPQLRGSTEIPWPENAFPPLKFGSAFPVLHFQRHQLYQWRIGVESTCDPVATPLLLFPLTLFACLCIIRTYNDKRTCTNHVLKYLKCTLLRFSILNR